MFVVGSVATGYELSVALCLLTFTMLCNIGVTLQNAGVGGCLNTYNVVQYLFCLYAYHLWKYIKHVGMTQPGWRRKGGRHQYAYLDSLIGHT